MPKTPLENYRALLAAGEISDDAAQARAAAALDKLAQDLSAFGGGRRGGVLERLFGSAKEVPRGLYIHGDVGRGKSMLMDLFFHSVEMPRKIGRAHV